MRKLVFVLSILSVLCISLRSTSAPPPGFQIEYTAYAEVFDLNNNPVSGVTVRMRVDAVEGTPEQYPILRTTTGITDAYGRVTLRCYIDYDDDPILISNLVYIDDSQYFQADAVGERSETSRILYPDFWIGTSSIDINQNEIPDAWEMPLAQKFCPYLILEGADQGVRPVPVEIMDRNGDGILDTQDMFAFVKYGPATFDVPPSDVLIYGANGYWNYANVFPDMPIYDLQYIYFSYGSTNYNNYSFVVPHFEWGPLGETTGNSWYTTWAQKIAVNTSSWYQDGTTYAHFFKHGSNLVIQYYFYYPFNHSSNRHEGDWEHINVVLDRSNPTLANIVAVEYYFHKKYKYCTAQGGGFSVTNNTHPIVYSSGYISAGGCIGSGSHGSYPSTGTWDDIGPFSTDEIVHGDGLQLDFDNYTNIVILPDIEAVSQSSSLSWLRFPGLWGHTLTTPSGGEVVWTAGQFLLDGVLFNLFDFIYDVPADCGNVGIPGPAFQQPWNNLGQTSGNELYF